MGDVTTFAPNFALHVERKVRGLAILDAQIDKFAPNYAGDLQQRALR